MADIFNEVDEDIRRDQYARLWRRYRWYVLGAAIVIVVGVGAWLWWDDARTRNAEDSGERYMAALQLAQDGDHEAAAAAFGALAQDSVGDYPVLARFRQAAELTATDPAAGVRAYDALVADTSLELLLRDLARVLGGYASVDIQTYAQVSARVTPAASTNGAWRELALEVLALSAYANGMVDEARTHIAALQSSNNARNELVQHANVLSVLLDAGDPTTTVDALAPATVASAPALTDTTGVDAGSGSAFDFGNTGGLIPLSPGLPSLTGGGLDPFANRFSVPGLTGGTSAGTPAETATDSGAAPADEPATGAGAGDGTPEASAPESTAPETTASEGTTPEATVETPAPEATTPEATASGPVETTTPQPAEVVPLGPPE